MIFEKSILWGEYQKSFVLCYLNLIWTYFCLMNFIEEEKVT